MISVNTPVLASVFGLVIICVSSVITFNAISAAHQTNLEAGECIAELINTGVERSMISTNNGTCSIK